MKKKLLALIIAASFAICGCGSGSSTTSSAAEESAESEESGFVGLEYFEKLAPEGIDAKLWIVETGREEHEKEYEDFIDSPTFNKISQEFPRL